MANNLMDRVARAIWEVDVPQAPTPWERLDSKFKSGYYAMARAALEAVGEGLNEIERDLEFIAGGHTIPGYRPEAGDTVLGLAQEVIHGAQVKAKEALARLRALRPAPDGDARQ